MFICFRVLVSHAFKGIPFSLNCSWKAVGANFDFSLSLVFCFLIFSPCFVGHLVCFIVFGTISVNSLSFFVNQKRREDILAFQNSGTRMIIYLHNFFALRILFKELQNVDNSKIEYWH